MVTKCGQNKHLETLEKVKLGGSNIYQSTKWIQWTPWRVFLKHVWEQLQMVASAGKIYWEASLSKTRFFNWNFILKLLSSFLVFLWFETTNISVTSAKLFISKNCCSEVFHRIVVIKYLEKILKSHMLPSWFLLKEDFMAYVFWERSRNFEKSCFIKHNWTCDSERNKNLLSNELLIRLCSTLFQNVMKIITKCDSYFIAKCGKSLLQNALGFWVKSC